MGTGEDISHLPKLMDQKIEKRARWHSTASFILAAVGSAVGLGNVWRFPYLVSKNGGAPFLVPYIICLVLIGMPILLMELGLGQMFQGGDIEAFGRMNSRLRGLGLASVFGSFVIVTYYMVVLAYAGMYFVASFMSPIPYALPDAGNITIGDITSGNFFYSEVLRLGDFNNPTYLMNGAMVLSLAIIWVMVYLSIFNGVQTAGWVVYVTVPLPVILIIVLLARVAILPGADGGVKEYIGKWNGTKLQESTIWVEATGQVFFTLSVCMGVMTAYSSHNTVKHQVGRDEKIISLSDMAIALLGGFTVYCMLGYLAAEAGTDAVYDISSMTLAFVAYPAGISVLTGSHVWGVIFFLCLILLGVDSAFSMVEAVTTVITDSWISKRYKLGKPMVSLFLCLFGFACSLMYTMDVGLYLLDVIDHYINNWGMIFLGFMECVCLGWMYKFETQTKKVGFKSVMIYNICFFWALLLGIVVGLLLSEYDDDVTSGQAGGYGVLAGLIVYFVGLFVSYCVIDQRTAKHLGGGGRLWAIIGWHGPDRLRKMINCTDNPNWKPMHFESEMQTIYKPHLVSMSFGFLIKYFIPTVLWVLFFTTFKSNVQTGYGGYPWSYQTVGILIFAFMACLVLFVAIFPRCMIDPRESGTESFTGQLSWLLTPGLAGSDKVLVDSGVYGEDDVVIMNETATGL